MHLATRLFLALLIVSGPSISAGNVVDPDLAGLWGSETIAGRPVDGALTLERRNDIWTARIGGYEVEGPATGSGVHLELPGNRGTLRAHVEDQGRTVRGFWIQPGEFDQPWATPVELRKIRPGVWRGDVVPLEERLSLYLLIRPDGDGGWRGAFHNPEFNWRGGASWFRIVPQANDLKFIDPATGKTRFVQPFDREEPAITMSFGAPIALTPMPLESAAGMMPRTPVRSWSYRAPLPNDDGLSVGPAEEVGLDPAVLTQGIQTILAVDPTADSAPRIHSILVARHGRLVLEEYFYGFAADRPHDLRSASKSLTSLMAGIAMERGAKFNLETPVLSLFEGETATPPAPRKADITVGNLLTHTSGLACDDNDDDSPGNEDVMQHQGEDWYGYILGLPLVHDPGTTYAYCSGGLNLVGGIIARTTGTSLPDFFDRHLARPLGIDALRDQPDALW